MAKALTKGEMIYEGIPYTKQGTSEYKKRAAQNTPTQSLGSHILNITRLNMYSPKREKLLKRKGSVDFIDSNTVDRGLGPQTIGHQRGEIQTTTYGKSKNPTYNVYSNIYGGGQNPVVLNTPHFNLNPKDKNNKFFAVEGKKAADELKKNKLYPFK